MSCASCGKTEDWCRCSTWCGVCGGDTNHTTAQHEDAGRVWCRSCLEVSVHDEDDLCPECLSEQASYYMPDEGGNG